MRLVVLGNSQRLVAPLGTGTSYLVQGDAARVVVDAANGTHLALARRRVAPDAVVVSHFHADALFDLAPVVLALRRGSRLFLPTGTAKRLEQLLDALDVPAGAVEHVTVAERSAGESDAVGALAIRWGLARHGCRGSTVRFDHAGKSVALLGDTGPLRGHAEFARGADLVVAHAHLLEGKDTDAARTNLTAADAGRIAAEAGAGRLALAHPPLYRDAAACVDEARRVFGGPVAVLREGVAYDL